MLKLARESFGAAINLHLSGPTDELSLFVNRLFNFGVISNVPDTYDAQEDTRVMVQSDAGRLHKGYLAMALSEIQQDKGFAKQMKGRERGFLPHAQQRAWEMLDAYSNHGNFYSASNGRDFPTSALRVAPRYTAE